jgi:hypothetical protein
LVALFNKYPNIPIKYIGIPSDGKGNLLDWQNEPEHRAKLTPLRGIDYANHTPDKINPIPPDAMMGEWEMDYQIMQESMLNNPSLPFDKLIERMQEIKARINNLTPTVHEAF